MEENDDLFYDIKLHLFYQRMKHRDFLYGEEVMNDDRYLTDFTLPWKGIPDVEKVPEWYSKQFQEAQRKANATSTPIGNGPTRVTDDPDSSVIQIWSSEGAITIQRADIPELIRALQRSVAGPTAGGATGSSSLSQRSAPRRYETRPNQPGWKSQAQMNDEKLDYAYEQERKRQNAVIEAQQAEYRKRNSRW